MEDGLSLLFTTVASDLPKKETLWDQQKYLDFQDFMYNYESVWLHQMAPDLLWFQVLV